MPDISILVGSVSESYNFLSFMQSIQFRNLNQANSDSVAFRISSDDYDRFKNYLNSVLTPSWANTDAAAQDNQDGAVIRAAKYGTTVIANNALELTVDNVALAAPGNFASSGSGHGSLPDLHVGYVAAALTGAHEGRAILLNENAIFPNPLPRFHNTFNESVWSRWISNYVSGSS